VTRMTRCLVLGVAGLALILGPMPAFAGDLAPQAPSPTTPEPGEPSPGTQTDPTVRVPAATLDLDELPVDATDVTTTDASLRATAREVTVLTTTQGTPTVTKLRTDSARDARELVRALEAVPGVVAAPTRPIRSFQTPREPLANQQTYLRTIGAEAAWPLSQGAGVRVAVLDSGVDATHPDLVGRVAPTIDLLPATAPTPAQTGHGTRVASIIAAARNRIGIAGVAPAATILPVETLDPSGLGDTSTVARGVIAAANAGARVINLSLGGPDRDPVLDRACAYAVGKGAVVVAAGGNSYDDGNLPQYPAASPHVIGVASVDARGLASLFANSGPYIDLAAPGENLLAAAPGGYDRGTGTSFAAPQVSGTVALMIAADPALRPAALEALAERTAQDDPARNGLDQEIGYGVVRADRAVRAAVALRGTPALATARARVASLNATPEPLRKHRSATVTARVQLLYPKGVWRASVVPSLVRFEFKAKGSRKYRTIAYTGSISGVAQIRFNPKKSGRWRAQVLQPGGAWAPSRSDYVRRR
jgi:subtilisin family serine protease